MDLAQPIFEELERQGHSVLFVVDKTLSSDGFDKNGNSVVNLIKKLYSKLFRVYEKYWEKMIQQNPKIDDYFDLLFCIQGFSFHPYLLDRLRKRNPTIRTSLYIWDANIYYNFFRNLNYFDKCFTFDYKDASLNEKINFLPFYWIDVKKTITNNKYDVSIIGSDHDGRCDFVEKIYTQIYGKMSFYFKIVIEKFPFVISDRIRLSLKFFLRYNYFTNKIEKWKHKLTLPFTTFESVNPSEVIDVIRCSNCILDTDRDAQTGTTPRIIWALAFGKKIISSNTYLTQLPFYNEKQIRIVNKENPIIDINFIKEQERFDVNDYILGLRIDKWVCKFL